MSNVQDPESSSPANNSQGHTLEEFANDDASFDDRGPFSQEQQISEGPDVQLIDQLELGTDNPLNIFFEGDNLEINLPVETESQPPELLDEELFSQLGPQAISLFDAIHGGNGLQNNALFTDETQSSSPSDDQALDQLQSETANTLDGESEFTREGQIAAFSADPDVDEDDVDDEDEEEGEEEEEGDPSVEPGEEEEEEESDPETSELGVEAGAACFVATAAFRSRDHHAVVYLRNFRDTVLRRTALGRLFIATYWVLGPLLAAPVLRFNFLAAITRALLIFEVFCIRAFRVL